MHQALVALSDRVELQRVKRSKRKRGVKNSKNLTHQIFEEFEYLSQVGRCWREIFSAFELPRSTNILLCCAGYIPKVELGLYYYGFQGALTLLELHNDLNKFSKIFYNFLSPKYEVKAHVSNLFNFSTQSFDLVAANHFLDDFIFSNYCQQNSIQPLLADKSCDEYLQIWEGIFEDPKVSIELMDSLAHRIAQLLDHAGHVVFLDYPSKYQRRNNLGKIYNFITVMRANLKRALAELSFFDVSLNRAIPNFGGVKLKSEDLLCMWREGG